MLLNLSISYIKNKSFDQAKKNLAKPLAYFAAQDFAAYLAYTLATQAEAEYEMGDYEQYL